MTTKEEMIHEVDTYSAHNYHPLPVVIARGEGVWVWDSDGNKYLDCLSAYSAMNQGHRHPRLIQALKDQADRITLTSRAFHNDQMGPFLKKLCELTQYDQALPMNTGAEAVETAIKLARKWGYEKKGIPPHSAEILIATQNFHGRTTTIVSFSSEEEYRSGFGPFTPGFRVIPYGDLDALEKSIGPNTVAFLYEPIQGEAGVIIPPAGYLTGIREICQKFNILSMDDEIQTGLGRTGQLFCYQHEAHAKPDVLILGKALGGGVLPVSAVLASRTVMEVFTPGTHGSTFGGNPLGAAVGRVALEVIESEHLPQRSLEMGTFLQNELRQLESPLVEEVRGKGLMIGVELKKSAGKARPYCEKLMKLGVLMKDTHEQVIRISPPLVIQKEEIQWLIGQLKKVL